MPERFYYFVKWRKFRRYDALYGHEDSHVYGACSTLNPQEAFKDIKSRIIDPEDDSADIGIVVLDFRRL